MASKEFPFKIVFSAVDKVSGVYSRIQNNLTGFTKSSGLTRLTNSLNLVQKRFEGVSKAAIGFGATIGALGAATYGGIFALANSVAQMGDELDEVSGRVGISIENLQKYSAVAKKAGIDSEEFTKILEKFNKNIGDAKVGKGSLKSFLESFSPTMLKAIKGSGSVDEALKIVISSLDQIEDSTLRAALATAVFGKAGMKMITFADGGNKSLAELVKEVEKLGGVMTQEEVDLGRRFSDRMDDFNQAFRNVKIAFGVQFQRSLIPIIELMTDLFSAKNRGFIDDLARKVAQIIPTADQVKQGIVGMQKGFEEFKSVVAPIIGFFIPLFDMFANLVGGKVRAAVIILASVIGANLIVSLFQLAGALANVGIALGVFVAGNPVMAGIIAFALLATLVIAHWKPISQFFANMFSMMIKGLNEIAKLVQPLINFSRNPFQFVQTMVRGEKATKAIYGENYKQVLFGDNSGASLVKPNYAVANSVSTQKSELLVSFENMPKGVRVVDKSPVKNSVDLNLGYSMVGT